MARPLRVEYPGAYYHVTARGVARQVIFFADEDRQEFLETLAEAHERFGLVCHGYCLMLNHYHLPARWPAWVETPQGELSWPLPKSRGLCTS
jgi:REP element-mobilizing transposase RayT